jgi:hypothetical protein
MFAPRPQILVLGLDSLAVASGRRVGVPERGDAFTMSASEVALFEEHRRKPYFFSMVQALVVVFEREEAFLGAATVVTRGVDDIAGEDFLPEYKAAGGPWKDVLFSLESIDRFYRGGHLLTTSGTIS